MSMKAAGLRAPPREPDLGSPAASPCDTELLSLHCTHITARGRSGLDSDEAPRSAWEEPPEICSRRQFTEQPVTRPCAAAPGEP